MNLLDVANRFDSGRNYIYRVSRNDLRMGGKDAGGQRSDGGGLARDSRQIREVAKLDFKTLK